MTRSGVRSWWPLAVGLSVGVVAVGAGVWLLVLVGLEDADRWASVVGVFLNLAGVAVGVWGVVWTKRASKEPAMQPSSHVSAGVDNTAEGNEAEVLIQATNVNQPDATVEHHPSGGVSNRAENNTVSGPLVQGRNVHWPQPLREGGHPTDGPRS